MFYNFIMPIFIILVMRIWPQACLEAENKGRRLPFTGEDMDQELAIEVIIMMRRMRMIMMIMGMVIMVMMLVVRMIIMTSIARG